MKLAYSWSYSAYSTAVQCLRKYKLTYVDKIVPEGPDSGDLVFGSALHSAINACLTGQDGQAVFQLYWLSYKEKDVEYGRFKWEELATIGATLIRKFQDKHAGRHQLQFAEQRLFGEYRGVKLEGTPDFYGLYSGIPSLRDFKTSARNYEPGKALCATQLNLYAFLYHANKGEYPQTLGYTVFNKAVGSIQDLTWEFSESSMFNTLDDLVAYCTRLPAEGRDFYPRNLNACYDYSRKCQFFETCHGRGTDANTAAKE